MLSTVPPSCPKSEAQVSNVTIQKRKKGINMIILARVFHTGCDEEAAKADGAREFADRGAILTF
jgi:hypothetical protein